MCYQMAGRSDLVIDFNAPREVTQHELSILTADEASVTCWIWSRVITFVYDMIKGFKSQTM